MARQPVEPERDSPALSDKALHGFTELQNIKSIFAPERLKNLWVHFGRLAGRTVRITTWRARAHRGARRRWFVEGRMEGSAGETWRGPEDSRDGGMGPRTGMCGDRGGEGVLGRRKDHGYVARRLCDRGKRGRF